MLDTTVSAAEQAAVMQTYETIEKMVPTALIVFLGIVILIFVGILILYLVALTRTIKRKKEEIRKRKEQKRIDD